MAAVVAMASMLWIAQGCTDVEVSLVHLVVATVGGVDGWRGW